MNVNLVAVLLGATLSLSACDIAFPSSLNGIRLFQSSLAVRDQLGPPSLVEPDDLLDGVWWRYRTSLGKTKLSLLIHNDRVYWITVPPTAHTASDSYGISIGDPGEALTTKRGLPEQVGKAGHLRFYRDGLMTFSAYQVIGDRITAIELYVNPPPMRHQPGK